MKVNLGYYKKIFGDVETKSLSCLYLLQGSEIYIMEEMAAKIVARAVAEDLRSFNLTVAYGAEADIESFIVTASSYPFLSDKRVLVLKEIEKLRGGWKKLIEYCRDPVPSSIVIFLRRTTDESGRRIRPPKDFGGLESAVAGRGTILAFDKLGEKDLVRWIRGKAKKMNIDMSGDMARILVGSVGENLYDLQNELEKLHVLFENKDVTRDDLRAVLGTYRVNVIYDLLDSIKPATMSTGLGILSRIIGTGAERPSVITYHLIRYFLSLLKVKAGYRVGGSRYGHLRRTAELFQNREITIWLDNLRVTELLMKSTSFPEGMLLESALLHSMQGARIEDSPEAFYAA